jgi:hypothetical protein
MIDIIIYNILFWSIYIWVCSLPYQMFQKMIDEA